MSTIFEAFGISCLIVALFGAAIFIIMTFWLNLLDSSFKRIITGAFLVDWIEAMWDMFTLKGYIGLILACGMIFTFPCLDAMQKGDLEKQGKHTCTCKVCQKTFDDKRYGEAAIKYLGLDEDDIADLLSKTNGVAKRQSR